MSSESNKFAGMKREVRALGWIRAARKDSRGLRIYRASRLDFSRVGFFFFRKIVWPGMCVTRRVVKLNCGEMEGQLGLVW